ncbi:transposase [Trichonephila clavipes]|nr:transposase [Trichonephila clavipes]
MKNVPAFRPGILPGRRVNGYKADSSRYFAGIFRPYEARNKDEGVLVHCYGGMSRSPTIIMAYLMRKLNFTANEVYHFATSRERLIRPNLYFRRQLSVYEEALRRNVNSRRLTLSRAERLFRETPENDIPPQFGLTIHQNDHQARRRFVEWAQNEIAVVPDFHKRILFSDEAHFWLNGYVNKQNCRIWSEADPQVYVETPLHPEKLTVWSALWAGGIIGPYFFKNDDGHNVTVNGDRYRAMITNFFIPELNNHDVQELWFQQDGATCHTARATIDLLKDTFGGRLISRFGPVNWPPRSCDLTPLDYFLWGYVKSLVYADKPQTLDHLEDNIRRVIADIRPQMLEKVIENWTSRLDYIRASRGSPMPEIIFKISALSHTTGPTTTERPSIKTDSPLIYEMTSLLLTSASPPMPPHQSSCSNHTAKESTAPRELQRTLKTPY